MQMTLREAAEAVGRNKSTVFRAIQDGKLKAQRSENNLIFIDSKDLMEVFPPEDPNNRAKTVKRGRPVGSRKKHPDGTLPETPQIALMGQEIIRLETLNKELQKSLDFYQNRTGADTLRLQDITLERERLLSRINVLERNLDDVRTESAAKDSRIYELKTEKDALASRMEKLENTLSEVAKTSKEPMKKSLMEKIFA